MKNIQAFPTIISEHNNRAEYTHTFKEGMTLLDYFAGQVLGRDVGLSRYNHKEMVRYCYDIAEAMLKEREKRNEKER